MGIRLYKYWWLLSLKALLFFGSGFIILLRENPSFIFSSFTFGGALVFSGIFLVTGSFLHKRFSYDWTWWLFEGLLDILTGVVLIFRPGESTLVFLILTGFWALLSSIILLITSVNIFYYIRSRIVLYLAAFIAFACGLFFLIMANSDFYAILSILSMFFSLTGLLLLLYSFQLKEVMAEDFDEVEIL